MAELYLPGKKIKAWLMWRCMGLFSLSCTHTHTILAGQATVDVGCKGICHVPLTPLLSPTDGKQNYLLLALKRYLPPNQTFDGYGYGVGRLWWIGYVCACTVRLP